VTDAADRDVRPEVVEALWDATTRERSDEHLAELLYNATPAERRAAADMHYEAHLRLLARLDAYRYAMIRLTHEWQRTHHMNIAHFTIGRALKLVSPEVAEDVLTRLYDGGWTEDEVGYPPPTQRSSQP